MSRLSGQIAVVIGSHEGIGGAIAQRFAAEGATVYATSRRVDESDTVHGAGALRARRVDASDVAALDAFFEAIRREEGRVDVLAVSAGLSDHATLGFRLIHSQNASAVARATPDRKLAASLS